MSYPKRNAPAAKKQTNVQGNAKLSEAKREKLLAIQEREQLKGLLVNKFLDKYGKNKGVTQAGLEKEVTDFIKNEKLTEDNLRKLEQRIRDGKNAPTADAQSTKNGGTITNEKPAQDQVSFKELPQRTEQTRSYIPDDALSIASSTKPKSVYQLGDEDDEWATMMKYDTELHRKERELEKLRSLEQKRRMKEELDRQLEDKKKVKDYENQDLRVYMGVVDQHLKAFDNREKKKEEDFHNKVMQEKYSRDKQLHDEKLRKKLDHKTEKEIDSLLVRKIQNEIEGEVRQAAEKRREQKEQLRKVLLENEERRIRLLQEAQRQKDEDTRAQQEYTRLIEKQEAQRAAEIKAREDRAKQFMSLMADTIIKDQKEQILDEERKLLKYSLDREAKEIADDRMRQQRLYEQKREIKKFLDKQTEEKEIRRKQDKEVEKIQADIWKQDTEDFFNHEKNKFDKIRTVNVQQAEFLKQQMEEDKKKKYRKMNAQELLLNKQRLKEIAEKTGAESFQKSLVSVGHSAAH